MRSCATQLVTREVLISTTLHGVPLSRPWKGLQLRTLTVHSVGMRSVLELSHCRGECGKVQLC